MTSNLMFRVDVDKQAALVGSGELVVHDNRDAQLALCLREPVHTVLAI